MKSLILMYTICQTVIGQRNTMKHQQRYVQKDQSYNLEEYNNKGRTTETTKKKFIG